MFNSYKKHKRVNQVNVGTGLVPVLHRWTTTRVVPTIGLLLFFSLVFSAQAFAVSASGNLAVSLTVLPSAPFITSIVPSSGARTGATNITISGYAFTGVTNLVLSIGSVQVPITSFNVVSDSTMTATVPAGIDPGIYTLKATNAVGTSADNHPFDQFTVTNGGGTVLPSITGIYPSSGSTSLDTNVAIIGDNFTGATSVTIDGVPVKQFQVVTDEQINAVIQSGLTPGVKNVKVSNAAGTSLDNHPYDQFTVTSGGGTGIPTVTSVIPNQGPYNASTPVVINGTNFTGSIAVRIGDTSIPFQVMSDGVINATVPAGLLPGQYHVTVSNQVGGSQQTSADIFTVTYPGPGPFVTDVIPDSGANTSATNVVIKGFFFTGATQVRVGTWEAQINSINTGGILHEINATIPANIIPGIYHVVVTTPQGRSPETPADEFTVTSGGGGSAPVITKVTPDNGSNLQNTPIVITGSNFTGVTSVQIGSLQVQYLIVNDGEIHATVPAGLTPGPYNITATNPHGVSNGVPFAVTSGTPGPQVWYINPSSAAQGETPTVAITGINFTGVRGVTIGGVPVTSYTFVDDQHINAVIPGTLSPGKYHILVTTLVGTSSAVPADIFTVNDGGTGATPTVTDVNPDRGANLFAVPIVVSGTNFTGATAVTLTGITNSNVYPATYEVISATEIKAVVPKDINLGQYHVIVSKGAVSSAANPNDIYTVTNPAGDVPAITGIIPSSGANSGTTNITISGSGFTGVSSVTLGGNSIAYTYVNDTTITAVVPAGLIPSIYTVKVANSVGTSPDNHPADQFTVTSGGGTQSPTITGIYPSSGANTGVTYVAIIGTNFTGTRSVSIEGIPIQQWQVVTDTQINATVQAGLTTGIKTVKVTNGVGTSADNHPYDQFTVTSGGGTVAPTVTSVVPNTGPDNAATPIVINGSNFTGTAVVRIGITSIPFQVITDGQINATVPAGMIPGPYHITVTNQVGTSPTGPNDIFTVTYSGTGPFVTSVIPSAGPNTSTTNVVISGFNFTGATNVTIGGVPVQSFTVNSATQITAVIQSGLTPAIYHVRVITPQGISPETPADEFTVTSGGGGGAPTITGITPNTGSNLQNTPIVISGSNFTGTSLVLIGNFPIPFSVINDGEIQATVPSGLTPGTYNITVTNPYGTSNGVPFTVTGSGPGPQVWYIQPQSGANTSTTNVTITGINFSGATAVTIGGVNVQGFTVNSSTQITAVIQAGLTPGIFHIQVTTPVGTSPAVEADRFTVTSGGGTGVPTVTSVNPNSGSNLYEVPIVIRGTNFTGTVAVNLNAASATYLVISDTEIRAVVPAGLAVGVYNVKVTNGVGTSPDNHPNDQYTVTSTGGGVPAITGISPNSGATTTTTPITIYGSNLTGVTSGTIGSTPLTNIVVVNDGQITANVPAGITPGTYHVQVTNPFGTSSQNPSDQFTVTSGGGTVAPTINSVNPNSGPNNQTTGISIVGDNFTGTTQLLIGTTQLGFQFVDDEHLNSTIPAGLTAGTYHTTATNQAGTSTQTASDQFTVIAATPPTVTGVSPNTGPNNQTTTVSVGGTNFTGATSVTIGGTPVQSFNVVSPTEITAVIQSGITPGTYHIQVTTPAGTSSQNPVDQFTVTQGGPQPVVTGINPNSGPNDTATPITINGTNLGNPTGVQIGNTPITFTPVSDSQVNATVPTGMVPGVYYITVTTPYGTSTPGASSQFTVLPPSGAPATPEGMTMTKSSSSLVLGWQMSSTVNVDHYNIYRGTSPTFVPSSSNRIGTSTTLNYTDSGALTASDSYYYRVTAQSVSGAESMVSNMGYKLNKHLYYNQNISSINWISIPYRTPYINANSIALDIPNATQISRFNPSTQKYEDYQKFLGSWVGNNFNVTPGESYLVVVGADSDARLVGWHDRNTTISMTYHTTISNINWTSIPYHAVYTNAKDVVQSVGPNITQISRFNPTTQNYEDYQKFLGNWVGVNFNLSPGEGYAIIINSDVSNWKPSTYN